MLPSLRRFSPRRIPGAGDHAWADDLPIRHEVFGEDRLREHGISLASSHRVAGRGISHHAVLGRVRGNYELLKEAHASLLDVVSAGGVITPAAEWLVDNFYTAEQHIQQVMEDLPSGYYRQLPKLAEGHLKSYPRVMAIAWTYIAHADSHFDRNTLTEFVNAYQTVTPLTIGELWALAIHLRILLIENATRVATRTAVSRDAREMADGMAEQLVTQRVSQADVNRVMQAFPEHARLSFAVHLVRRIRGMRDVSADTMAQVQDIVHATGHDTESAAHEEHARQAANNLTMQNIFTSLKRIAEHDWDEWFGGVSMADRILAETALYRGLDGTSRTTYRSAIEDMAQHSGRPEQEVARLAVNMDALGDPGEALLGARREALQREIGYRVPLVRRVRTAVRHLGVAGYVSATAAAGFCILLIGQGTINGLAAPVAATLVLLFLLLAPAFDAAMAMVNFAVTQLMRPMVLPGLAFENGIPREHRTLIAVPVMITSFHGIEEMLERIEGHFLSNDESELFYALLSDLKDSSTERSAEDGDLLAAAEAGIAELNTRHGHERFMLLHRSQKWNESEQAWMGWERKRGKLHELNRLLRGARDTTFLVDADALPAGFKYVIVLDADTLLPRGVARRLVGKMAHPLNRPSLDKARGRVTRGYGILQPRVTISLPENGRGSLYQKIFASRPGLDPYVFTTSDVYQDLFGEGSFTGKGIYDIDAFEAAMAGRIPENTMLSHDLFEGNFVRAGLATDVQVVEDFPDRYIVDMARHHRWTRGDWQLLPWMFPPTRGLSGLGFWKMLDNLRRSLAPAFTLAALAAGWWLLPAASALAWTAFLVVLLFIPSFLPIFSGSSLRREPITIESQLLTLRDDIVSALSLTGARLILLAHQSWVMIDAVVRTIYRLTVSRRNLLEWTTAAQLQASLKPDLAATYRLMLPAALFGALMLLASLAPASGLGLVALPFAIAWLLAPAFAYYISRPVAGDSEAALDSGSERDLRVIALRTWRYFDAHVVPGDNMLPPDNLQEDPVPQIAHRTSPTNIGLYLLSTVSACEMGWIGTDEAAARLTATLGTVSRLESHRGHLYNWYDTQSLQPLEPRYISSVDSGNLAGHLIAVANACEAWSHATAFETTRLGGMVDASRILQDLVAETGRKHRQCAEPARHATARLKALSQSVAEIRQRPELVALRIMSIGVQINVIEHALLRLWDDAGETGSGDGTYWTARLRGMAEAVARATTRDRTQQASLDARLRDIVRQCRAMAYGMDFAFLENQQRQLLSIGYRMEDESLDQSCYDLLASEAALTSFFAIAKGDIREKHWIRLGRPVVAVERAACLVSWSGSMFEYLMPLLVMKNPEGTLNSQSMRLAVRKQISHAGDHGTPWGISESAYAARDRNFTYQYSNFGVPGLGLKRGLGDNHVIAPYATGLAAMIAPRQAAENYRHLERIGGAGRFGFYEAIDFTPSRLRAGQTHDVIRAFFAHHQGMTITAIHNAVSDGALRRHFHRENTVRAAELLLQERAPHHLPSKTLGIGKPQAVKGPNLDTADISRHVDPSQHAGPATHILSNGHYAVMLTARGTGYSRWNGIAVNRWRPDPLEDESGLAIFLRDVRTGETWPATPATDQEGVSRGHAIFSQEKAEFHRSDDGITTHLECLVSTEDDAEARCLQLVNTSDVARTVEYTTFMELALAHPAADSAHPAFSKLFVETEFEAGLQALVATRRRRQASGPQIWVGQFIVSDNETASPVQYETAREAFLGRSNPLRHADALAAGGQFASSTGSVLDPVLALRQSVTLQPHRKSRSVIWTIAAESREALLEKISRHRVMSVYERVQVLAWTQARILLRHLSVDVSEANLFQQLSASMIYSSALHRPSPQIIATGMRAQSTLWPLSISGNRPIALVLIGELDDIALIEQVLRAQDYWQEKRLAADIVIVNERRTSYLQDLQNLLDTLVAKERVSRSLHPGADNGEIFLLRADLLAHGTLDALMAAAHVVLHASHGKLERQLQQPAADKIPGAVTVRRALSRPASSPAAPDVGNLQYFNGFGGFDADAREYVVQHQQGQRLPAPWISVIANPHFGTHCSAEGGGYTWFGNSRERQVTAWSNDAVTDRPSEVFYVSDQDTGELASPTVEPLGSRPGAFRTRHGFGYTVHDGTECGLAMELIQTIDTIDPVKCVKLRLTNGRNSLRKLRITFYAEPVLGQHRAMTSHFVTSEYDTQAGALFLRNRWNPDFGETVVFADLQGRQTAWSGNRHAVLGAQGAIRTPLGLLGSPALRNETGGGFDPCIALQRDIELAAHETAEIVLTLGAAESADLARQLVSSYREREFSSILDAQRGQWLDLVEKVQVKTPDPSFDLMMNGWLLYQTISCRMWARAGFYQASGAYGFRDQLQDSMTLAHVRPDLARKHILTAASRQFVEGDVQHWWLPETGAGVRTRISDDTVWLAYCTAYYVGLTGDTAILDERIAFLEGRPLQPGEHDAFYTPAITPHDATLYEHCVLALSRNLEHGAHGLPLMGAGDWNDGMNRVGEHGEGESVWLGWFLCTTLAAFEDIARQRKDARTAENWSLRRDALAKALDRHGWDGAWYRRAYFDDGTPLGTSTAIECQIDTIAQSWAVISGVADPDKARSAMDQVEARLIDWDARIAHLFWPPFENHVPDPGYIQSYPAGIRENGGQYSHGAIWAIYAFARLGETEKAARLFAVINPINHALTEEEAKRYKVEPYAMVADIYSVPPHRGRGGWTWYTGAAGWSYRAGLEAILGIRRNGARLTICPCVPQSWHEYEVNYRHGAKRIVLRFARQSGDDPSMTAVSPQGGVFSISLDAVPDGTHFELLIT